MLSVKQFSIGYDYGLYEAWALKRRTPYQEPDLLPKLGLIVWEDKLPICCGFLFQTDAKIAIIGSLMSDPIVQAALRSNAIDLLLKRLVEHAKSLGFKAVSAASNVSRLGQRYEALGFTKTDDEEVHYGRIL